MASDLQGQEQAAQLQAETAAASAAMAAAESGETARQQSGLDANRAAPELSVPSAPWPAPVVVVQVGDTGKG